MSLADASATWGLLEQHCRELEQVGTGPIPGQTDALQLEAAGLWVDLSRNRINDETLELFAQVAQETGLPEAVERLFTGAIVNISEQSAALHTCLRAPVPDHPSLQKQHEAISAALEQAEALADRLRRGSRQGSGGQPIQTVVHLGIGGSLLGPQLAVEALTKPGDGPDCRFVSSLDRVALDTALKDLDPASTLFMVASKSFATEEPLVNAEAARNWLRRKLGNGVALEHHFAAITANTDNAKRFGVPAEAIFPLWQSIGGRFSLWSAIGLPLAISGGNDCFREMLAGARAMDEHFRNTPPATNLPMLLGLLDAWHINLRGARSLAVMPYAHGLRHLPAFLQQLVMESNGKSIRAEGAPLAWHTAPVLWGGLGTEGQHAFCQWLHQGSSWAPVDFVLVRHLGTTEEDEAHNIRLWAHCLAQAEALATGRSAKEVKTTMQDAGQDAQTIQRIMPHRVAPGGRPSTTTVLERLEPRALGALLAMWEARVYTTGVLWGINSFDQWAVEMGKERNGAIRAALSGEAGVQISDTATARLVARYRK